MTKDKAMQISLDIILRYRKETPLGNQPHMIALVADEAIEALRTALSQPEPEPVAWAYKVNNTWEQLSFIEPPNDAYDDDSLVPLYTAPQQRNPLTDDQIWKDDAIMSANSGYGASFDTLRDIVRAIEAAHGIRKEK